jgi:hypothetical protein
VRQLSRWFMAVLTGLALAWIAWAVLSPVLPPLGVAGTLVGAGAGLFALHLFADYAERREWIYYRTRHGTWNAVGAAMAEVQAIYRPGQQHVRELKERADVRREDDDEGAGRFSPSSAARSVTG